jgi:D-methionine transport system ATP-binding protein
MIKIQNLNKTFPLKSGNVEALRDVSMEIQDGEVYGVIGYSGAGKSTLVRCINLLERPDSGFIQVNGVTMVQTVTDAKGNSTTQYISEKELNKARHGIGMIFQHFNLLDRSTVFDNIAYPLKHSGMSKTEIRDRVVELLELVDLQDKINVYPSQLSGGQKQRVAIARALANKPQVLLSDEATSALDPDATESILELLKKLNKQLGLTIVLITHEMAVIKSICDRVAVMEYGSVVEEGNAYQIFADPKAPITQKFVNSTSSLSKLDQILEREDEFTQEKKGCLARLTFVKESVGESMISTVSRKYKVNVDIVLANVELLQEGALGKMIVVLKGEDEDIREAINYMTENKVRVEVLEHVAAN